MNRDLSSPLAPTFGDPVKRANRRNDRKLKKAERKNVVGAVSRKEQRDVKKANKTNKRKLKKSEKINLYK